MVNLEGRLQNSGYPTQQSLSFFFFCLMSSDLKISLSLTVCLVCVFFFFAAYGIVYLFSATLSWTEGDVCVQAFRVSLPSAFLRLCLCVALRSREEQVACQGDLVLFLSLCLSLT